MSSTLAVILARRLIYGAAHDLSCPVPPWRLSAVPVSLAHEPDAQTCPASSSVFDLGTGSGCVTSLRLRSVPPRQTQPPLLSVIVIRVRVIVSPNARSHAAANTCVSRASCLEPQAASAAPAVRGHPSAWPRTRPPDLTHSNPGALPCLLRHQVASHGEHLGADICREPVHLPAVLLHLLGVQHALQPAGLLWQLEQPLPLVLWQWRLLGCCP